MAFYLPNGRVADMGDVLVAPGAVILAESQALVVAAGNQAAGVLPSTGTASDIFAGFAIAGTSALPFPEAYTNKVETFVVPTGGVITLSLTPVAGQVLIYDVTTNSYPTVTLSGQNLSGLTPGDTVNVTYKYAMSIIQQRALFGDVQPGGYSGAYVGQIGLITRGDVWISEFDASKNWAAASNTGANQVCLAANGQLTLGTPGTAPAGIAVPNCIVTGIPSQTIPYLGLRFSAA
jgi:hypothetical protein